MNLAHRKARLGLIALGPDVNIENDLHSLLGGAAQISTTRIPLGVRGSASHLVQLLDEIPNACRLLAAGEPDAIAFGCTSGVAANGLASVLNIASQEGLPEVPVVDPLSALITAAHATGATNPLVISPYPADIAALVMSEFRQSGLRPAHSEIQIADGLHYSQVPPADITAAVMGGRESDADAVVLACTALSTLELIEPLESELGIPVLTSNQSLAWLLSHVMSIRARPLGILFDFSLR